MQISEVREQMEKMLLNHWKGWVDEKFPPWVKIHPARRSTLRMGAKALNPSAFKKPAISIMFCTANYPAFFCLLPYLTPSWFSCIFFHLQIKLKPKEQKHVYRRTG
jgi:hypothetical protein